MRIQNPKDPNTLELNQTQFCSHATLRNSTKNQQIFIWTNLNPTLPNPNWNFIKIVFIFTHTPEYFSWFLRQILLRAFTILFYFIYKARICKPFKAPRNPFLGSLTVYKYWLSPVLKYLFSSTQNFFTSFANIFKILQIHRNFLPSWQKISKFYNSTIG